MTNLIVEMSKYALILLMALYTCMTFLTFRVKTRRMSDVMLSEMTFVMLVLQFVAYLVLYLKLGEKTELIYYYGFQALFLVLIIWWMARCQLPADIKCPTLSSVQPLSESAPPCRSSQSALSEQSREAPMWP